jgi:CHAT domain-containing protein
MEPLHDMLEGAAQVGVVADGSLACVPFHALTVGGESMLDKADTLVAPSAAVLLRLASRPRGTGDRVVIGVADERAPRAEDEARAVAAAMGACRVLTGPEATVAAVKTALRGAGGVHIAAHARFVPHSPMQSAIRLSDGWLTARDLYGIELDGGLVVLSACDSGRTAVTHGREVLGLVRAFMSAGAGALVLSHWLLHDETAAATFADMYDSGVQCPESTADPAAALRRAQRCCRERLPHVAAWGPLYMVGGWNRGAT